MSKVFEVFYSTSCDNHGQEHSSSKTIDAETAEEAERNVLYEIEKDYPDGECEIIKSKDITAFLKI